MPCSFITSLAYPPHHTHTHTHYLTTLPEEEGSCPAVSSSDSEDEDELKSKKSWKPRRETISTHCSRLLANVVGLKM